MGFIVSQPDCRTTSLLFKDPTISNNNELFRRCFLSCSGNELLTGEAFVCNDNVGTQGVGAGGGEVEVKVEIVKKSSD